MDFDLSPLWISLRTSLLAGVLVFVSGVLCARAFLYARGAVKWTADVLFTLPLVLPPTVVGFFLLVIFGRNSPVGRFLGNLDISLVFSFPATVLAAVVVSFPLMYRAAQGALAQVPPDLLWAARTLGMPEWQVFLRVMAPQAWPGIAAGAALAFARALGEFGATMMIAGNIPGRTQTMPVAIYFATSAGKMQTAAVWVAVITVVSCAVLGLMHFYNSRQAAKNAGGDPL